MALRDRVRYFLPRILLAAVSVIAALAVVGYLAGPSLGDRLRSRLVRFAFDNLPEEAVREVYRVIGEDVGLFWDTVPEPLVARIGKRGATAESRGTVLRFNNAGMRASRPYGPKGQSYRIVCLGDSYVMGTGGAEEDRFCDRLEQYYRDRGVRVGGKPVETLALGLGGWTLLQSVTYLSSRLSAYEPDLILAMVVANDITDNWGVTGSGALTAQFSPEARQWGSGVFSNQAGIPFRQNVLSSLTFDLTPESRRRWSKAIEALERLAELQRRSGGRMLVAVQDNFGGVTAEVFRKRLGESPASVPFVTTGFFPDSGNSLPHDSHPNRLGHWIMASHFIHVFSKLGWIEVEPAILPELDERLSLELNPPPVKLEQLHRNYVNHVFRDELDFSQLGEAGLTALLGGIFPEDRLEASSQPPWASIRSGFLLRPPAEGRFSIELEIEIPPKAELFPFEIEMFVNATRVGGWTFPDLARAGRQVLRAKLPESAAEYPALEVVLETQSYFAGITDHRMKSFRLWRAGYR